MKIGDGNPNAPNLEDLLARMERAHRQEAADGVNDAEAQSGTAPTKSLPASMDAAAETPELHSRLLETAACALDGAFESADALRGEVVEAIVEQRYADGVPDEQVEQIKETVRATLTNDPIFRREVDTMLVLAAQQLARAAK